MPIYDYECIKCQHVFEVFQKIGEGNENLTCTACGETNPRKLVAACRTNGWSTFLDNLEKKISPHKFK